MGYTLSRFAPPAFIYALIFYLSSRPAASFPHVVPDIIPHFIEYLVLSFFFFRMLCYDKPMDNRSMYVGLAVLFVLAFLDELHQYHVPSRFFELKDLLVDGIGIMVGLTVRRMTAIVKS